jgi:hypothetical protein
MSISIATMGKFWPATGVGGGGVGAVIVKDTDSVRPRLIVTNFKEEDLGSLRENVIIKSVLSNGD